MTRGTVLELAGTVDMLALLGQADRLADIDLFLAPQGLGRLYLLFKALDAREARISRYTQPIETAFLARLNRNLTRDQLGNVLGVGAVVSDVLPLGIDYVTSIPPGTYDPTSRTVTWSNVTLVPNQSNNIDLMVQISGTPGQTITNTAHLPWGNAIWTRAAHTF